MRLLMRDWDKQNTIVDFYFNFNNLKSFLNIKSVRIPSLENIFDYVRARICPVQITKYGTVGRSILPDERKSLEKLFDYISDYFYIQRQNKRNKQAKWRAGFKFFDYDSGKTFTNMTDIKNYEKQSNKTLISWRDRDIEKSKGDRQVKVDMQQKIENKLHEVLHNVRQGYSYTNEMKNDFEQMKNSFKGKN